MLLKTIMLYRERANTVNSIYWDTKEYYDHEITKYNETSRKQANKAFKNIDFISLKFDFFNISRCDSR